MKTAMLLLTALALLAGCSGVEGVWQSREKLSNGKRNQLGVDPEGDGDLIMYVKLVEGGGLAKLKYGADWEIDENDDYDFKMKCKSGCVEGVKLDFSMECAYGTDQLDCKAKSPFTDYGFFDFEPKPEE